MGLPIAFAATAVKTAGITLTKSPRYGGGDGPLFSTVNAMLRAIAAGSTAEIERINSLRQNDADKAQWGQLWREYVPLQPMTDIQRALFTKLDPSMASTPRVPGPGPAVEAQPGAPPPITQALAPLQAAIDDADRVLREGVASSIERVGVGGGAAAARAVRGGEGPLDRAIEFAQKPAGTAILVVAAIVAVVVVARALR